MRLYLTLANGHRKPDPSGHVSSSELFEGWEPRVPLAVRCMQTCSPRVCCYLWVNKLSGIGSPISICHCCSFGHCPQQMYQGFSITLTKIWIRKQWTSSHPTSESCTFRVTQNWTAEKQHRAQQVHL